MEIMGTRLVNYRSALQGLESGAGAYVGYSPEKTPTSLQGYFAVGHADDHGTFYAIPQLAEWLDLPVVSAVAVFYYGAIILSTLVGLVGFAVYFRSWTPRLVASAWLISIAWYLTRFGDVYLIAPCCAMACVPWILILAQRSVRPSLLLSSAVAIGFIAAVGNLMRAHAGTTVLLLVIPALAFAGQYSRKLRFGFFAALAAVFCSVNLYQLHLLHQADLTVQKNSPENAAARIHAHLFWHSVYIGMGYLPNPYGIEYADNCGAVAARRLVPDVAFCSVEYDRAIRTQFFAQYKLDPMFFWQTIFAKFGITLLILVKRGFLGLLVVPFCGLPKRVLLGLAAALALSALPGILVIPSDTYLLGYHAWVSLCGIVCVGAALDRWKAGITLPAKFSFSMPSWAANFSRWTHRGLQLTAILVAIVLIKKDTTRIYAAVSKDLAHTRAVHQCEQIKLLASTGRLPILNEQTLTETDWTKCSKEAEVTKTADGLKLVTDGTKFGYQILAEVPLTKSGTVCLDYEIEVESGGLMIGLLNEAGSWVDTAVFYTPSKQKGRIASYTPEGKHVTVVVGNNNVEAKSSRARVVKMTVKHCDDLSTAQADALKDAKLR